MARARRKSSAKSPKTEVVRMRVTSQQKQAMQAAAARDGLELSQWLRQIALRAAGVLAPAG
jgi:uncharacterized protein (DUF1778 family)